MWLSGLANVSLSYFNEQWKRVNCNAMDFIKIYTVSSYAERERISVKYNRMMQSYELLFLVIETIWILSSFIKPPEIQNK